MRLDDYLEQYPISKPISLIKADVEGHEIKVFMGAKKTILKHKPILLFECHHAEAEKGDLFVFLLELGYEGFFFHGKKQIDYKQYDQYPYRKEGEIHRNYIFVKGLDNLSIYKNMLKYCYDNEKQVCNSFPHFREEIQANNQVVF